MNFKIFYKINEHGKKYFQTISRTRKHFVSALLKLITGYMYNLVAQPNCFLFLQKSAGKSNLLNGGRS